MSDRTAKQDARQLLSILKRDREAEGHGLLLIDNYIQGNHADPYLPDNADDEYKLLAQRATSNWMPLLISTPAQACYVDGFRPGAKAAPRSAGGAPEALTRTAQWDHWQRSRWDARQNAVYRGALGYGHSFVVVERDRRDPAKSISRGLSPLRTSAIYEDPASDEAPVAALYVDRWPSGEGDKAKPGRATLWRERTRHQVTFKSDGDEYSVTVDEGVAHGVGECPVTRFAVHVDLDGRTTGVVSPMIPLQDRINQTIFDLLVAQTYSSVKVRYATGMAPPLERDPETGEPRRDADGNVIPLRMNYNAKRFLFAEDPDTKFGSLDESPLGGFIESIDMSIRHLAAVSQTPPHHLLGQIANLSAEALEAAETSLARMVEEFRKSFGESWERVFRLAMELEGDATGAEDYHGEVIWRDMEARSLAQTADALYKLAEIGVPKRGLWTRIPGVTQNEIDLWVDWSDDEDSMALLASSLDRASTVPGVTDLEALGSAA